MVLAKALATNARRRAVAIGSGHSQRLEQQRAEHRVELLDSANAHGADRVAMISVAECEVAGFLRPGIVSLPPILKGHFQETEPAKIKDTTPAKISNGTEGKK